jgi:hypothetical protein
MGNVKNTKKLQLLLPLKRIGKITKHPVPPFPG